MTRRPVCEPRPRGYVADTSLPAALASPHEAKAYVGRTVCRYFSLEESEEAGWYIGKVIAVSVEDDTAFLTVEYEDEDTEELWWNDFLQWAVLEDASMQSAQAGGAAEAGGAAADDPHTPAGTALAAGGTAPRKRRASAAGHLDPASPELPTPVRQQQRARSASAGVHVKEEPGLGGEASQRLGPQRSYRSERSRGRGDGEQQAGDEDEGAEGEGAARPRVRRRLDMDQAVDQAGAAGAAGAGRSSAPAPPADVAAPGVNTGAGGSRSRAGSHGAVPQPRQHSQQQQQQPAHAAAAVKNWRVPRDPRPAGHLRRIQLVNFMCHQNLEVDFGPHVTFLSGQNGSGKSAVLQGLQACLGASARDTSRGSNLSGWVKVGCNAASVSLEVWNTRAEDTAAGQRTVPFKYELYGPVIRILRKIQAKGGGSFQLYDAHGTEVKPAHMGQTAAKEVAALADHFHVDAANPLMIITQDMAARFHQKTSGNGARCSKYEMFMEGTCLAAARDTLAAAAQKLLRAETNMQRQQGRLRGRKAELEQLEAKVQELQQTEDMRRLLGDVEAALMWSTVRESEEGLKAAKASAATAPARVTALEERLTQQQGAHTQLQEQERKQRAEMDDTRAAQLPARLRELEAAKVAAGRQKATAKRELDKLKESIASLQETKSAREAELQRLAAAGRSDAALQALAAYNARLNAKTAELERIQAQMTELEARRQALAGEQAAAAEQERAAAAARRDAENAAREAASLRDELAAAAAGGGADARQRMLTRRWGEPAMRLLEAVRRAPAGTFSRPPFGPVGMYLRRVAGACDAGFAALLEHALSNVLDRWIVNRREDSDRLVALAQQAGLGGWKPYINIVPYKDRVHSFQPGPLVRDEQSGAVWRRVIDLLQTAPPNEEDMNDTMRATLVCMLLDGAGAASTVLVEDRDTAQWVARGGLQHWGVWTAYDLQGTKYEERSATLITNVRPINNRGMSKLDEVAADKSAQLAEAGQQLAARQAEAGAAAEAHNAAVAEVRRLAGEAAELKKRQVALGRQQARCSAELSTLREETPAAASEAHSAELMNALTQLGRQLQDQEGAWSQAESQLNNAVASVKDAEARLEQAHRDGASYVARREELLAAVQSTGQQLEASARRVEETKAQLAKAREDAAVAQARIDEYERKVEASREEAEKECSRAEGAAALERVKEAKRERLRHDRSAASRSAQQLEADVEAAVTLKALKAWVNRTERDIERLEADGNLETIRARAEEARDSFKCDLEAYKAVLKKVRAMQDSQRLRDVKYDEILTYAERVVSSKFQSYMLRRNFAASMALSHGPAGRLELSVRPASQQDANATSSLMQLSGGERSFTTVAFLLAVGAMLDSPFRCCDEIDVFMDPSVRKVTTAALLEYAWLSNSGSQLVVLSPQDSKTTQECEDGLVRKCQKERRPVPPKDFCKILVLQPPRR
ncbi:hypothetical protein HYH02_001731 [Chlamydomonas schloesseri]|uniref:RecF/RecN/SMC N-terminal domain-containing protein n=1 Tax=Chlamydomonas schloesseri TaxID=2026947 RepID=A0A835WVL8_9CHLO|nr:hypothetical protein HYH02_001731 [Chlamydomonas schloesseri]|eukprot:KAG2453511.1 hypothetical protein HYH02_001731 [Chlamydomonas schloesseri]